ncbi:HD-GYP domain-containing protein [Shewanella mangrovi]|uniref:HD-GYP domain-containing protein n=1 Tax=Shewanella mangrovi TaxID=1515746 RepID=UPI00068B7D74|nr:HD domain-containing phosphohydrolase [Shewanella mangrovi]
MNNSGSLTIDLRQMILAIETAVSLVGMNDTNHGKRVGYIAAQIGNELGLSDNSLQYAFDFGLLHDCGVSSEQMHANLVNFFDWEDSHIHCDIGYHLLNAFAPLKKFALPLLHHHTAWQTLREKSISEHDKRMANLIFLSDRVDVFAAAHYERDILLARQQICQMIDSHSGRYFDPELVAAFQRVADCESFWIALEDRHITRYTWDMGKIASHQQLSLAEVKQLSLIISYIVDQKSPFTAQHSVKVADVAKFIATQYGLSQQQCDKIEIAGLLHDIGKLHTPDSILDKPGPLDDAERAVMNQHSYETYEILRHIDGMQEIARWAAYHHEGINNAGYPFHPSERDFSTEARIIAVADVFQALVQDRPYRPGMDLSRVLDIVSGFVDKGKLDKQIVQIVLQQPERCYEIARGADPNANLEYLNQLMPRQNYQQHWTPLM